MKIVLTGVNGGLGSALLTTILDQNLLPPSSIIISSSSSKGKMLDLARAAGIEIRHGDMTKPSSLISSYRGASALFLVSYPSIGEERFKYHKIAIDAAKEAGIKHVLYTSLTWGGEKGESSIAGVYQAHLKTTNYLKETGLSWTNIREGTYANVWNTFVGFLRLDRMGDFDVVLSNDGPIHFANRKELGEDTAKIVANCQDYINKTVNLTGSKPFTVEEIVNMYAEYSGRKITVRKIGVEETIAYHMRNNSVPQEQQDFLPNWASWGEALAISEEAWVDPTFEELLGRKPKGIEDMKDELFALDVTLDTKDFN